MVEVLLIVTFLGVFLSSCRVGDLGNPFQIYFFVWFLVFFLYWIKIETFIPISMEFGLLILFEKIFALFLLLFMRLQFRSREVIRSCMVIDVYRSRKIFFAQIVATVILPFAFLRAIELAGGESVFSIFGYINLRRALTEGGEDYGIFGYFFLLAFVVCSLNVFAYREKIIGLIRFISSLVVALSYVYLSTGRTFILLFLCLMIIPLVVIGVVKVRGVVLSIIFLIISFVFLAGMTARGVAADVGLLGNINSFFDNIRSYTVAPLLAFFDLVESSASLGWGENTFRFFISLIYKIGVTDVEPINLIKEYAFVPDATNVYTVYEVYFRDFSYFGFLVPMFFLLGHCFLYQKAISARGVWMFFYAASVYPLMMQFFQDQYFSLLSTWLQLGFWYWLFLASRITTLTKNEICHD